jgi:predicted esterase
MRIHVWLIGIISALLIDSALFAATPTDFLTLQTATGLPYRLFVPPGYNAATAYPLIVFLHGAGERGNDNQIQLNNMANGAMHLVDDANLALQPVLMAAPQCPTGGSWDNTAMATRLSGMVDEIAAAYHLDADRLYVTGLSMGGYGTWFFVTSYPTRFALAAPMSGGGDPARASSVATLPSWFFHAADDGTVGVDGSRNIVHALRNVGASVIYTEFSTGNHGIWPQAYQIPLLFPWMIAQKRNAPSVTAPPLLRITSPTDTPAYFTAASMIDLGGSTANSTYAISSIGWNVVGGMSGSAAGVGPWSAAAVPLPAGTGDKTICVTATGSGYYAPYGGATTFNDCLRVTEKIFANGFEA